VRGAIELRPHVLTVMPDCKPVLPIELHSEALQDAAHRHGAPRHDGHGALLKGGAEYDVERFSGRGDDVLDNGESRRSAKGHRRHALGELRLLLPRGPEAWQRDRGDHCNDGKDEEELN
jgi:hypothetical protein